MSPKASFDEQYKLYSPKSYVQFFLRDLSYRLPFEAMTLLGDYLAQLLETSTVLETAIVGSCHGLDSAVLKYGYTYDDILKYWLEGDPDDHVFYGGNPMYEITMIDINPEPLRFAKHVGLCKGYYRCNMKEALPKALSFFLEEKDDLLIAVGITTYLGLEYFQRLGQLVERSQIRFFCFSLPSFIRESYLEIAAQSTLTLKVLGDIDQRQYNDDDEKSRVLEMLKEQGAYSPRDDSGLVSSICVAYKTAG